MLGNLTWGFVPSVLQTSMLVMDSAQTQCLLRQHMCSSEISESASPGVTDVSSISSSGPLEEGLSVLFFMIRSLWFWILACPVASTVFASYLYLTVGLLGLHWNEGFSSLQHTGFKNFVRMCINEKGHLECYAVGLDKSPIKWVLDTKHMEERAAAVEQKEIRDLFREMEREEMSSETTSVNEDDEDDIAARVGAHTWKRPSKWVEKRKGSNADQIGERGSKTRAKIVDHFILT